MDAERLVYLIKDYQPALRVSQTLILFTLIRSLQRQGSKFQTEQPDIYSSQWRRYTSKVAVSK